MEENKDTAWSDERDWLNQKKTILELRAFGMFTSSRAQRFLTFSKTTDNRERTQESREGLLNSDHPDTVSENVSLLVPLKFSLTLWSIMTAVSTKNPRALVETIQYVVSLVLGSFLQFNIKSGDSTPIHQKFDFTGDGSSSSFTSSSYSSSEVFVKNELY